MNTTTAFLFVLMTRKVTCHIPMSYRVSTCELNQGIGQSSKGLLLYEKVGKTMRKKTTRQQYAQN